MVLTDASRQLGRTPDLGGRAVGVLVVGLPLEVHAVRALILDRLDVVPGLPAGGSGRRIVSARKHWKVSWVGIVFCQFLKIRNCESRFLLPFSERGNCESKNESLSIH